MATRVKLTTGANPTVFNNVRFSVSNSVTGYSRLIEKTFVIGVPANINQVQIGADRYATRDNLITNLIANNSDGIIVYSATAVGILVDFTLPGVYAYVNTSTSLPTGYTFFLETFTPPATTNLEPLELDDLRIEIIDTYDNNRSMIEEKTQIGSPKLMWDSGDDIYETLMSSKATFNINVPDKSDAKFFHLYSGDEKRFLVRFLSVTEILGVEVETLIWRGYLLPDQYDEPYTNSAFFVNFTAVDMIGTLKAKALPIWFYNNRFPIMRLFGYILQNTGLSQRFIVAPSLVPADASYNWYDINVPVSHYADGKEYANCYEILKDVLSANGMMLYSFRGYWFIKGITRKREAVNQDCFCFDSSGRFTGMINVVNKVSEPMKSAGTANISTVTPWKSVSIKLSQKKNASILSDEVVKLNNEYIRHINEVNPVYQGSFYNGYFDNWNNVGGFYAVPSSVDKMAYTLYFGDGSYSKNEAQAMVNYLECKEHPYLLPQTEYQINIEGEIRFACFSLTTVAYFLNNFLTLEGESLRDAFNFQIFIGTTEIASNRVSYFERDKFKLEVSTGELLPGSWIGVMKYTISGPLRSALEGRISVRILAPVFANGPLPPANLQIHSIACNKFEISLVKENIKVYEDCKAIRSINFTQNLDLGLNYTCTKNELVKNSFGIQAATNMDHFFDVETFDAATVELHQNAIYSPTLTELTGVIHLFKHVLGPSSPFFQLLFGAKKLRKNLFVTRANGKQESLQYIAGLAPLTFVFIDELELAPVIPENYVPIQNLGADDEVQFVDVRYLTEDISKRNKWKVFGFNEVDTFVRTLAKLCHFVRPETSYSLESTFLQCVFPNELIDFEYDNQLRSFIPTRIEVDLTEGKTTAKTIEAKIQELTDITYE